MKTPNHFIYHPEPGIAINLIEVEAVEESDAKNLHPNDLARLNNLIHHKKKRLEFIASRTALRILKPKYMLHYEGRCPILDGPGYISLAHSPQFGAAIHHPNRRVGIDVEPERQKLSSLASKFLNPDEMEDIETGNKQFKLQVLWGAKEALFKLHRMGGIEFKKHIFVDPIPDVNKGTINARIVTSHENTPCSVGFFFHGNQYVVYAVSKRPL